MFKHYVKRTIRKIFAIPLFLVLFIVKLVIKPLTAILRIISLPLSVIAAGMAAITYFNNGSLTIIIQMLLLAGIFTGTYIVAPYLSSFVLSKYYKTKETVLRPIVIRPPVRFTI